MKRTPTTIRLDDKLKKELNKELKSMGLSINGYFNLAARQLIIQKKVPFEVSRLKLGLMNVRMNVPIHGMVIEFVSLPPA